MASFGLTQDEVVAMPCNLVKMLQVGYRTDVPKSRFSKRLAKYQKRGNSERGAICQPVVRMTIAAMMPFWLVLPKDEDFRLNHHVERREISREITRTRTFSMSRLRPIITGGTTCGRHQYGAPLRPRRRESLHVSAMLASRLRIRNRMN
eukprot:2111059-Pleurochrysis_carterae.AAC.2